MKQAVQPAPAPRRPRFRKRTILLVVLGLLLLAAALLAFRLYQAYTTPPIYTERQPPVSAATATNPAPFSIPDDCSPRPPQRIRPPGNPAGVEELTRLPLKKQSTNLLHNAIEPT